MGRKAKYTFEQKLQAVLDYQSGKKSAVDIAFELDMGKMVTTEYVNGRISIKLTGKKLSSLKKEIHLTQKNSKNGLSFTFFFSFSCCGSYAIVFPHSLQLFSFLKKRLTRAMRSC